MKFPWTRILVLVILLSTFITVNVMDDQKLLREVSQGFFHIDSPLAGLVPFVVVFIVLTVTFFTNFSKAPPGAEED